MTGSPEIAKSMLGIRKAGRHELIDAEIRWVDDPGIKNRERGYRASRKVRKTMSEGFVLSLLAVVLGATAGTIGIVIGLLVRPNFRARFRGNRIEAVLAASENPPPAPARKGADPACESPSIVTPDQPAGSQSATVEGKGDIKSRTARRQRPKAIPER